MFLFFHVILTSLCRFIEEQTASEVLKAQIRSLKDTVKEMERSNQVCEHNIVIVDFTQTQNK